MRGRWRAALLLALVLVPAWTPAATADTGADRDYRLGTAPLAATPCETETAGPAACFALPDGTEYVHLAVDDAVNDHVAVEWRLEGADGAIVYGSGTFCGDTVIAEPDPEDFPVQRIRVTVFAPGPNPCPGPAFGTEGTITATFATG